MLAMELFQKIRATCFKKKKKKFRATPTYRRGEQNEGGTRASPTAACPLPVITRAQPRPLLRPTSFSPLSLYAHRRGMLHDTVRPAAASCCPRPHVDSPWRAAPHAVQRPEWLPMAGGAPWCTAATSGGGDSRRCHGTRRRPQAWTPGGDTMAGV